MLLNYLKLSYASILQLRGVLTVVLETQEYNFAFIRNVVIKTGLFRDHSPVNEPLFRKRIHGWILTYKINYLLSSPYKVFDLFLCPFFFYLSYGLYKSIVRFLLPFNGNNHDLRNRIRISSITSSCGLVSPLEDCSKPRWIDAFVESLSSSQKSWSESPKSDLTSLRRVSSWVVIIFSTILNFIAASITNCLDKFSLKCWQFQPGGRHLPFINLPFLEQKL